MAISVVQVSSAGQGAYVPSVSTPIFDSNVTTGNSIVVGVFGFNDYAISPYNALEVTDSVGNSYTNIAFNQSSDGGPGSAVGPFVGFWMANNVTGGVDVTTTLTVVSGTVGNFSIVACEVSGIGSTIDNENVAYGTSDPPTAGALSTGNANDIIFVGFANGTYGASLTSVFPPVGYTVLYEDIDATTYTIAGCLAYKIVSTTLSDVDPTFTSTSGTENWYGCGVAVEAGGTIPGFLLCNGLPVSLNGLPVYI